jgi:CelD/BcsL family acetyltransferase involved in cellulose biosynthesis
LHALLLKDEIVNRSVSFVEGKTLYWPLTINTGRYLEYYPGLISLYLRLQEAADSGIETFQMGFGDFLYKSQSETHTDARRVAIVINPKSIKGQLFGVWARYKSQKRLLLRGNH